MLNPRASSGFHPGLPSHCRSVAGGDHRRDQQRASHDQVQFPDPIGTHAHGAIQECADRGELDDAQRAQLLVERVTLEPPSAPPNASHFIAYIRETIPYHLSQNGALMTTLVEAAPWIDQLLGKRAHARRRPATAVAIE